MPHVPPDFKEFLRLLNANGVEYLVVGGYAVSFHGYPRTTGDIDIWIRVSDANVDRAITAIRQFGFSSPSLSPALFQAPGSILRMGFPPVRIEIQTEISGVNFDDCFQRAVAGDLSGEPARFISKADLVANKRAAGRPKDLDDLSYLA